MNLSQTFREEVARGNGQAISDTFDLQNAKANATWNIEHNADGTHSNVTADSITVETLTAGSETVDGDVTVTGNLLVAGTVAVTGAVTAASALIPSITANTGITTPAITAGGGVLTITAATSVNISNAAAVTGALSGGSVSATGVVVAGTTISERGRTTPVGEWIVPTVTDANFRGSATGDADWVVNVPGDVSTFQYTLVGKTLFIMAEILTSDVANAPISLIADIPGGFTANKMTDGFCRLVDAGARNIGSVQVAAGGTTMVINRSDFAAFTNTGGGGTTSVRWQIFFEIQ